jgi:hypothetical protein
METITVTRAITHIRLRDAHHSNLAALDQLAAVYLPLCQTDAGHFCITGTPDAFADPLFDTPLSARWQRVAIQQAAGIAQSWLTNRPTQQTFCCEVCGYKAQADVNASVNLARRAHDDALGACRSLDEVKALLMSRHEARQRNGCP